MGSPSHGTITDLEMALRGLATSNVMTWSIQRDSQQIAEISIAVIVEKLTLFARNIFPQREAPRVIPVDWADVVAPDGPDDGALYLLRRVGHPDLYFSISRTHVRRVRARFRG